MAIDLTGIKFANEYYTNHYLNSIFEENAIKTIKEWREKAKQEEKRTPWSLLRESSRQFYVMYEKGKRSKSIKMLPMIKDMADIYLNALAYEKSESFKLPLEGNNSEAYIYSEIKKQNGAPLLWILLSQKEADEETAILYEKSFDGETVEEQKPKISTLSNEEMVTKLFFSLIEAPRWIIIISENSLALLDRNKWNEKRYIEFDLKEIFSRREETTLQAMSILLHKESLCPDEGIPLLDILDENSHRHASGVSKDLKYALRESIELLGNEVLYDRSHRQGIDAVENPIDSKDLSIQCLRYMYRILFMFFIEARPELGYAPMKSQPYLQGYSLESLRDITEKVREETDEIGEGYFIHETLSQLFDLIYNGYPKTEEELKDISKAETYHHIFIIEPLKAHIFDPEYTTLLTTAKLRNSVMLRIIDIMSITRPTGRRNQRPGRISYAALGINQMGAVYEALLSYSGFIAKETLYEVKRARDDVNELDVGYFVPEKELGNYTEEERARYPDGRLRKYEKGTFIYRLAGREREKSASYYTPEVLTKCLVKYALKELLEGKAADEIINLTVCEPAMGSAAFLNEAINQLAEAYLDKKQKELGIMISHEKRFEKLQKVKMYIADRNVYGIDLNPIAVELAEVSLWLNTIHAGGYVPWFGMQLVCGNSLIGARRQCYKVEQLQTASTGIRWYDNAPERVPLDKKRMQRKQIYHFLTGDPGMSNYKDRVMRSLAPDNIAAIKSWNKKFIKAYDEGEIENLQRLSAIIDDLWEKQIKLRKEVEERTSDRIDIFGQDMEAKSSHTTIRQKDLIYKALYKSEEQKNAGPYARLKFAMDYWCSLWFWPIDKAELLPSRSEFIADMYLILEGTIDTFKGVNEVVKNGQISFLPTEQEQLVMNINELTEGMGVVDIPRLCELYERLGLVREIANKQKFMHWELEFSDIFYDRGGFDLILGNPPWVLLGWNEQDLLSDSQPMFAVKNLSAAQTVSLRNDALNNKYTKSEYLKEYESITGMQSFLNANQNYHVLAGMKANLYKCFLPQAWQFSSNVGVFSFLHPEGIYDDHKGGKLREKIYPKLRKHFHFQNERKLFPEVANRATFSVNIYSNHATDEFESISNLFEAGTIDQCYESDRKSLVGGIKNKDGNWNTIGHPDRIISIGKKELILFAKIFDGTDNWKQARLPVIHSSQVLSVLKCFYNQKRSIKELNGDIFSTICFDETAAQKAGTIIRDVQFPKVASMLVYSGPHIGVANPFFKSSQKNCNTHRAFDNIDLISIGNQYYQRLNYKPNCCIEEYNKKIPTMPWGAKYNNDYRILSRKMLNLAGERTLISAIIPQKACHIITTFGISCKDRKDLLKISGILASLPYDFIIKVLGQADFLFNTAGKLPLIECFFQNTIDLRTLLLNCLSIDYENLWNGMWVESYRNLTWTKSDPRLRPEKFSSLTSEWTWDTPLRTDYERRQALVEIDVLTSMALGMTLDQLKTIYRIQFPVLQQYEADTWYDQNGRIVFTVNRSLTGVGFSRAEFEPIKDAKAGEKFYRTITDDTMPGGPIERTIEYVAPFDKCDREEDYETAWKFFEKKYGKEV